MVLSFATLVFVTLYVCVGVCGVVLLRRRGWRFVGGLLLLQALLALVAQIALSTIPFGFEPLIRVPFQQTLLQAGLTLLSIGGVAVLVWLLSYWLSRRWQRLRYRRMALVGVLLAVPLLAPAGMWSMMKASLPERERERDPNKREIVLPSGFSWTIYAQGGMDNPTSIAFGDDGALYIGDIGGTLWIGRDTDGDDVIDTLDRWADGFTLLVGLAWHDGELYAASSGKIEALRDSDSDGVADQRRTVVDGLPSMILMPHSNNGLAFGPDGRLYFGVGSTTDGKHEPNELAAAILSINPDGSDLRAYARGLGNSFDVAFNSEGELFAGDNAPSSEGVGEAPDEFNHIIEGEHYGYPYYFGDPPKNGGTRGALVSFPPHSAPTGVTFYSGTNYPPQYQDSAFITLWARGEVAHVEVARTNAGEYLSRSTTFGSGFLYPIDAVTGPDGNLYIADFGTSAIYRITYDAAKDW